VGFQPLATQLVGGDVGSFVDSHLTPGAGSFLAHAVGLLLAVALAVLLGPELTGDLRCRFVQGDFFALAASEAGFDPAVPARRFDAVLMDIDHSPAFLLDPQNAAFYGEQGLSRLAAHLRPGGIFALWSNDRLDDAFTARLRRIFADARAEEVTFHNPLQDTPFTQTVYLAKKQAVPRADNGAPTRR
jgi:hypothetical protein